MWHLGERQILGETTGRQAFRGARQQRQEGAAGRVGASGAALEPGRHAGAGEGVLEQPEIGLRRAQQHGHLVEGHAARRRLHDTADNLDRLPSFAWRREQMHGVVEAAFRRRVGGEQPLAQSVQRRWRGLVFDRR